VRGPFKRQAHSTPLPQKREKRKEKKEKRKDNIGLVAFGLAYALII